MGKAATVQQSGKGSSGFKSMVGLLLMLTMGVLMLPFAVVLFFGMIPSYAAWMVDQREEKNASITVAMLNFCGVVPIMLNLWNRGGELSQAFDMLKDPFNLLSMYGAAGMGWLLIMAMPPVMMFLIGIKREEAVRQLTERMHKLQDEWGDSITNAVVEVDPETIEETL
ncbi:MAG: hypothetical protein EYC62_02625 [Alphaproteobacteria bacterium]|nr:MAG: hypothetical protein EYC62_02625 [Alphaproteobacteria bacterium]